MESILKNNKNKNQYDNTNKKLLTKSRFYAGVAVILIAILLVDVAFVHQRKEIARVQETQEDLRGMLEQLSEMDGVVAESRDSLKTIESEGTTSEEVNSVVSDSTDTITEYINTSIDNSEEHISTEISNSTENINSAISDSEENINNNISSSTDKIMNEISNSTNKIEAEISESTDSTNTSISNSKEEINKNIQSKAKVINEHLDELDNSISKTRTEITNLLNDIDAGKTEELADIYSKIRTNFDDLTIAFNSSIDEVKDLLLQLSRQSKEQYEDTVKRINELQTEFNTGYENNMNYLQEMKENDNANTNTIIEKFGAFFTSLKQEFNARIDDSELQLNTRIDDSDQRFQTKATELDGEIAALKAQLDQLTAKVNSVDTYYPIGSLYLSLSGESPADKFGGSWQLVAQGQSLMGAGNGFALGSSGGSYTYTLSQANLPNYELIVNDPGHGHSVNDPGHSHGYTTVAGTDNADRYPSFSAITGTAGAQTTPSVTGISINGATTGISVNSGGGNQEFSLLSPYLVVNVWQRIA